MPGVPLAHPELIPTLSVASGREQQSISLALLMTSPTRGSSGSPQACGGVHSGKSSGGRIAPFEEDKECRKHHEPLYSLRVSISSVVDGASPLLYAAPCASLGGRRLSPVVHGDVQVCRYCSHQSWVLEVSGTFLQGANS